MFSLAATPYSISLRIIVENIFLFYGAEKFENVKMIFEIISVVNANLMFSNGNDWMSFFHNEPTFD